MNNIFNKTVKINDSINKLILPQEESIKVYDGKVLPFSIVKNTRGYIETVTHQINNCYINTAYDGCAVLIRRLVETLLIETFEFHGLRKEIENANGDYFYLRDLVDISLKQSWKLSRNFKRDILKLKEIGDKSAHSKVYFARRQDIDDAIPPLRLVTQELLILSGIKT